MTPRLARPLLLAALALGALADWLLRADSWRAGFVAWALLVLGVAFVASERSTGDAAGGARDRRLLFGAAAALVLLLVLRDASTLYALDFFAFIVVCFLIAWRAGGRALTQLEPRDALIGTASAAAAGIAGAPTLALHDAEPAAITDDVRRKYRNFAIGALAAAPVLLVVALLLGTADPLFAGFLEEAGNLLDTKLAEHLGFVAVASWATAGALRGSLVRVGIRGDAFRAAPQLSFGIVAPLLGGLALLLSIWIGLQVRTLFGGAEYVAVTAGVTVAEYARQGFFELIVIAGIVLAALLVTDDVLDRDHEGERAKFRSLGALLVLLVGAVLTSAVLRLGLYLKHFGLTDDRVLALAVLVWVALVLGWFALTVLRGARARFAPGVLVLSAAWLGGLNLANPERVVVQTNLARAERGLPFDVAYHATLSADAVPALQRGGERLDPVQSEALRVALAEEWAKRAERRADWRRWSLPFVREARRF